jgi:putative metallohydrolase (TIGR04338 family)
MRERDGQRARVYKSDKALTAIAAPLLTVKDIERYVKRVMTMKRVRDTFPRSARYQILEIKDGRGRRSACGWSGGISIPTWARNEGIVIHELAHVVCQREHGYNVAGHGWQFCSIYLTLTLHAMGREAHDALKKAFKENRVRYTKPRARRQLSDEQRQALADRLALGRLAAASERRAAALEAA